MKALFLIPLLFLAFLPDLKGQSEVPPILVTNQQFQDATRSAIDSLYNRKPEAARELMEPWSEAYPEHPVWQLWEAMELWWLVLTDLYDTSNDDELFEKMELADRAARNLLGRDSGHADGYLIRAVANGYIARQHANRDRWLQSLRTARYAQKAHEQLGQIAPDLSDNLFAEGLKKYYAAYLPEAYPVVRTVSWLLPDGDKREGLNMLERTSRDAVFARPEANYFLGVILLNYEHNYDKALVHFKRLVEQFPDNSYYRRLLVRTLFHQRQYHMAEEEIRYALQHWSDEGLEERPVLQEELLYWRGRILMNFGRHDEAHEYLGESYKISQQLPNSKNRSFHVFSGYYAGLTAEWMNDFDSARDYYQAVMMLESEKDTRDRARARLEEL